MSLGFTLSRDGSGLSPYQERVIKERDDTFTKIQNQIDFMDQEAFKSLSETDRRLLIAQKNALVLYFNVLELRILSWKEATV